MRTTLAALSSIAILAACASGTSLFFLDNKNPSEFSPEERAYFDGMPSVEGNSYCLAVKNRRASYSQKDVSIVGDGLRKRGFSGRDVELILDGSYGTGMSFPGLVCLVSYEPQVNTSFYPGVGHQWQAVLANGDYVYLEGDGTRGGMRVTSWN